MNWEIPAFVPLSFVLRIVLEVFHQAVQLERPVLLWLKFLQVEVKVPVLETVHPLAGSAQTSARASHCVRDQYCHVRVSPMDVLRSGTIHPAALGSPPFTSSSFSQALMLPYVCTSSGEYST